MNPLLVEGPIDKQYWSNKQAQIKFTASTKLSNSEEESHEVLEADALHEGKEVSSLIPWTAPNSILYCNVNLQGFDRNWGHYFKAESLLKPIQKPMYHDINSMFTPLAPDSGFLALPSSVIHEFLWLKSSPGSNIHFSIKHIQSFARHSWNIVIELPVKEGFVSGTSYSINQMMNQKTKKLLADSSNAFLCFDTCFTEQVLFQKQSLQEPFNVQVSSSKNASFFLIMGSMREELWTALHQVTVAAGFFRDVSHIQHLWKHKAATTNLDTVELTLASSLDFLIKGVTAGIEALDVIKEIDLEDQLIVLKETLIPVCFMLFYHTFNQQEKSFVFPCLDDNLMFCVHEAVLMSHGFPSSLVGVFKRFLEETSDFLRQDFFVMCILCLLHVFDDTPGLSCGQVFHQQRHLYLELLEKYINANTESGRWTQSSAFVWNSVNKIMEIVSEYISLNKKRLRKTEKLIV